MTQHPALEPGNVAVITGGADGIGLAVARLFLSRGLRVCIADINGQKLEQAVESLGDVLAVVVDVSSLADIQSLKSKVYQAYGRVDVLMNNAGTSMPSHSWHSASFNEDSSNHFSNYENWQAIINANLWGVINGVQTFVESMIAQSTPALIINTGSKQGITTPPGNPAYNVSKAGIKSFTEALQHDLRSTEGCQLSAHLLVPGFTYSGLVSSWLKEKPESAWTTDQVAAFLLESLQRGDFYILCPDNDTPRELDNKRMAWAMGDLIENRPALSRWHPDYQDAYEEFVNLSDR